MATDFTDPIQERAFREKASQYYTPAEVDKFINEKKGFQQEVGLYSEGKLSPDVLTPATQEKYAIEAAKQGKEMPSTTTKITSEQQFKLDAASRAIDRVEETFGRGKAENIGTEKDLSLAKSATGLGKTLAKGEAFVKKQFNSKYQEDLNIYTAAIENAKGIFTQAFGQGTPQAYEAESLLQNAPGPKSTDKETKEWFKTVRSFLGELPETPFDLGAEEPMPSFKNAPEDLTGIATLSPLEDKKKESEGINLQDIKEEKGINLRDIAGGVAKAAPVAGGIVGGFTGGFLGLGVGSLFTGALGTAIGTGAGIAFENTIQDLLGSQDETSEEQLKDAVVTPATAAALDLAGGALFMGGGALIKAGGRVLFNIGDDIALRAIRPSPSQQRKFAQKTGQQLKDFVVEKGLFGRGVQQVTELITPLQSQYDDLAIKSGNQIDVSSVISKFDDEIARLTNIGLGKADNLANSLLKEKDVFINKFGQDGVVDIAEITGLRRAVDEILPASKFMQDTLQAGSDKMLRDIYKSTIDEATEGITKDIGSELQKLYAFRDIAEAQSGLGKGTLPFGLIRSITTVGGASVGLAGGGDLQSTIKGALVGFGLQSLINNPKVISYLAQNLPIVGKAVQGLPANQKARIITDAFRRLLTNIGAVGISRMGID